MSARREGARGASAGSRSHAAAVAKIAAAPSALSLRPRRARRVPRINRATWRAVAGIENRPDPCMRLGPSFFLFLHRPLGGRRRNTLQTHEDDHLAVFVHVVADEADERLAAWLLHAARLRRREELRERGIGLRGVDRVAVGLHGLGGLDQLRLRRHLLEIFLVWIRLALGARAAAV